MFLDARRCKESTPISFDLPEGESEIIAGYFIEYSGFKFALFFLAEYLGMFAISGMAITLFLGGWTAPLALLDWLPSWLWFFGKLMALIYFYLDTRDRAAIAHRSTDAFCPEIHASDGADQHC